MCECETAYLTVQHVLELAAHVKTQAIREQDTGALGDVAQTVQFAPSQRVFPGPLLKEFRRITQPRRIDVLNRGTDGGAISVRCHCGQTIQHRSICAPTVFNVGSNHVVNGSTDERRCGHCR